MKNAFGTLSSSGVVDFSMDQVEDSVASTISRFRMKAILTFVGCVEENELIFA